MRVDKIEDLFDASEALSRVSSPRGPRLGIVTNAGGPGVMACDRLLHLGGELAELTPETDEKLKACLPEFSSRGNPVDVAGDADAERFALAAQALIDDPNCDGVLAILTPQAMSHPTATAQALIKVARTHQLKPLLTSFMGEIRIAEAISLFHAARVPTFNTPEDAVGAYMYMYQYTRNLANLYETPADILPQFEPDRATVKKIFLAVAREGRSVLTEPEATEDHPGLPDPCCAHARGDQPGGVRRGGRGSRSSRGREDPEPRRQPQVRRLRRRAERRLSSGRGSPVHGDHRARAQAAAQGQDHGRRRAAHAQRWP